MTRFLYCGIAGILAFFVLSGCANPLTAPLIDASREGNVAEVQKLLAQGAPIEVSGGKHDDSPLATAAAYGHLKVVKLLLKHGADPNKVDRGGITPLQALALSNYPHRIRIATYLLAHGADPNKTGSSKQTPLWSAAWFDHPRMVFFLIRHGADVNIPAKSPPLLPAAQRGNLDVAKILVAHGARINQTSSWGATPLYLAALKGHLEMVKFLLDHGAAINQPINSGPTPYMVAKKQGFQNVADYLLSRGASTNPGNGAGGGLGLGNGGYGFGN
jgi:ankyrin